MEAQCAGERHNGINLTDRGDNQRSCDGCDVLFDTHFNLQEHRWSGCGAEQRKNQMKQVPKSATEAHAF